MPRAPSSATQRVRVVLFSGGRGSGALTRQLLSDPRVDLTIAINGYDDGASTGEVRRLLGDSLGPSDFRKNASRMAVWLAAGWGNRLTSRPSYHSSRRSASHRGGGPASPAPGALCPAMTCIPEGGGASLQK